MGVAGSLLKLKEMESDPPMPLPLSLPGLGGRVLPQRGVVWVAVGGTAGGVVLLRAALAGAGGAVVQRVRAVGAAARTQEEVGAAQRAQRVVGVRVVLRRQQFALGLQA